MAKRTPQIDAEVLACATVGMSVRAIAEKCSLSKSTISKILSDEKNGQKWTNAKKKGQDIVETERRNNQKKAYLIILPYKVVRKS